MEDNIEKEAPEPRKYDMLEVYEGGKFKTLLPRKYKDRKTFVAYDPTIIKSFIPGTIRKIYVKEGQKVAKGEVLMILEAMKMLNELMSPINGVVKGIHAKLGDVVANKQLLVELESAPVEVKTKKKKK
jgi:biotin carboxyl carrier protein